MDIREHRARKSRRWRLTQRQTHSDDLISLRIQKKRNARMKDALDETLMLSDR